MESELKNCPFCGGKAEIICFAFPGNSRNYYPKCKKCGCELRAYSSKQNAKKAWNKRTYDDEMIVQDVKIEVFEL